MAFDQVKVVELKQYFDGAEGALKDGEYAQNAVSIPAINELRYAGQHLLRYLTDCQDPPPDPDDDDGDDEWENAVKHCKRAKYDACEGPVQFYMKQIRDFQEDYRMEVVADIIQDYVNKMTRVGVINRQVSTIAKRSRQNFADEVKTYMSELSMIAAELPIAREELNKKIENRKKNEQWTKIGLIVAMMGVVVTIYFGIKPSAPVDDNPVVASPAPASPSVPSVQNK